jgi:uncharacterized protein (DUF362 family)
MENITIIETGRYVIREVNGKEVGYEKPARVLGDDPRVYVGALGDDVARDTADALHKIGAAKILSGFKRAGIKVNLGGGLEGCPSTFTDPLVVRGIIEYCKGLGIEPFVCEADMRGFAIDEALLKRRGDLWEKLQETGTRFVNLSHDGVPFQCLGLEGKLPFPKVLLDPETAIISAAVPKDHWECGLSLTQKNMYGAISDRRKAIYHRVWSRIDRAVAAAARILRPDIAVLGGRLAGAGWGPHFCVPVPWNRVIVGPDAIRVDALMAEAYGYPYEKVKYAMINAQGDNVTFSTIEGSAEFPEEALKLLRRYAMTPLRRLVWKAILFPQYFVPHKWQHGASPRLESLAASFHHRFVDPLAHTRNE